jgi:hypothetical protein
MATEMAAGSLLEDRRAKCAVGLALLALYAAVLLATLGDIGLTDDADAYLGAATRYARWAVDALGRAAHADAGGFARPAIDAAFSHNREHPPLAKVCMGATWWLLHVKLEWLGNVTAARVATVAFSTWSAWLAFSIAWDYAGRVTAVAAPLLLLTMPRFFFHSHVETLDVASAATCFFFVTSFLRGTRSTRWAVVSGVAFGLALLTKLNGFFLLVAVAGFALWSFARGRAERAGGEAVARDGRSGRTLPLPMLFAVTIGPNMLFAFWPWMWFDTRARIGQYLDFHLHHYGILFLYFGRIYENPPAPWHAPFVMTAITTPPLTLLASLLGAAVALRAAGRRGLEPLGLPGRPAVRARQPRRDLGVWLMTNAAVAIGAAAFLGAPKYGGVKLFLPLFPCLAVLGGMGIEATVQWVRVRFARARDGLLLPVAAVGAVVLPAAIALARIHPYELSYYNVLVGGLPGAVRVGFERQYYDLFYARLADWLGANLERDARVTFLPNNKEYVRNSPWWVRDGRIRRDLRFVGLESADVLVLTHERRWPQYPELARRHAGLPELWRLEVEGVPLLTVFRAGSEGSKPLDGAGPRDR